MLKLFAVRDIKANAFGNPFTIATVGLAVRSFADACAQPTSDLNKYPEDYMLFEIGSYDPNSAAIEPLATPKLIATAADMLATRIRNVVVPEKTQPEEVA